MLKTIFLVICLGRFAPGRAEEQLLGKGLWSLISIGECSDENLTKEVFKADVKKHKLSRTQDGLTAHMILTEEINDSYEGEYSLQDYMLDYCDMLTVCPFGRYENLVYLILNLQRVACLKLILEFKKCEGEDCCGNELVAL